MAQDRDELGQFAEGDTFTPELGDRICAEMVSGKSLNSVLAMDGMPSKRTVMNWLRKYPEFKDAYRIAQQERAECWIEEIIGIADDNTADYVERELENGTVVKVVDHDHIARSRLRVDTRKWIAAKMMPRLYGDKVETTHQVGDTLSALLAEIDGKSRALPG
jgi:hypothetical protein